MNVRLSRYPTLAVLADLYLDRLLYGAIIIAALSAGAMVQGY